MDVYFALFRALCNGATGHQKAIVHPYCNVYHDAEDEPTLSEPFRFEHDVEALPIEKMKEIVFNFVMQYAQA